MFAPLLPSRRARNYGRPRYGRRRRPLLEILEDRTLLSVYTVDSLTDTGQGSGLAGDLRYCINQATDGDTIQFAVQGTILASAPAGHAEAFEIAHSITIEGPGPDLLTISGGQLAKGRIFTVDSGVTVAITGLTVANGYANGIILDGNGGGILNKGTLTLSDATLYQNGANNALGGGAIFNDGTLTISQSTFSLNFTDDEPGGAICNYGILAISNSLFSGNRAGVSEFAGAIYNRGMVTVTGSVFSNNQANGAGGAIDNAAGTLTLMDSTLSGNSTGGSNGGSLINAGTVAVLSCTISGNHGFFGGGLSNSGKMIVNSSSILDNSAIDGGGIYNTADLTVINSTVSGNKSIAPPASAAGIDNESNSQTNANLMLVNCTIANNSVSVPGSQSSQVDSLVHGTGTATVELRNTIISGDGSIPDLIASNGGTFISDGHNLSSDDGGGFLTGPGDLVHTDPLLGPLQDNGGPTQTMALLPGSPAIGAGDPTNVPATDQRGFSRIVNGAVDIGAFQVQQFAVSTTDDSGAGSLRSALLNADLAGGSDITFGVSGNISLASALPDITRSVRLLGPGANDLTVQRSTATGTPAFRIFTVDGLSGGVQDITVTLSGLTVAGGQSTAFGGGISNSANLIVTNCTISGNAATPRGGGIYNSPAGTLTLNNSLVSGNATTNAGGGIFNEGTMTVVASSLSGNGGGGVDGGAIFNLGTLTVRDSTLLGNGSPGAYGGAIRNDGLLTVEQSTCAQNSADLGGAIYNVGALTAGHSTLASNTAVEEGGGIDNNGGTLSLYDTLVAGNTIATGAGPDIKGVLTSLGHNLIGNTSGGTGFVASDLLNVDPLLGPLQDNGGPTQTMALLPGSPAIDAGDNTAAPQYDQRGPGFPRIVNSFVDIGAFEAQPPPARSVRPGAPGQLNSKELLGITATILNASGNAWGKDFETQAFSIPDLDTGAVVRRDSAFPAGAAGAPRHVGGVTLIALANSTRDTVVTAYQGPTAGPRTTPSKTMQPLDLLAALDQVFSWERVEDPARFWPARFHHKTADDVLADNGVPPL